MWGYDTAIFTMLYLILTLWFHKIFKLIFPKSPSWPKTMYAEHWRKLAWGTFLENFPILLVQQFCGTFMHSCLLEYVIVFPIKNKFFNYLPTPNIRYFKFTKKNINKYDLCFQTIFLFLMTMV